MPKNNNSISLKLADFDYNLPSELIAQTPVNPREMARLMVLDRTTGDISQRRFFDLPNLLRAGDVLVFNDSKVIPARLFGKKETGGKMEVFLLTPETEPLPTSPFEKGRKMPQNVWQCLIGGKIKAEQKIFLTDKIIAEPLKKIDDMVWQVSFNVNDRKLFKLGEMPLPPYIKTKAKDSDYQNVYAKESGSVAAPTAGLHFSKKLLTQLKKRGIKIEFITLHVGLGTFLPVETENILEHQMHSELAIVDAGTAKRLSGYKLQGRRIIAVGTTVARTLESLADNQGKIKAQRKMTDIFIYPGYQFKIIDGLITNFHLPKSTLLMLVSAFISNPEDDSLLAGRDKLLRAYQEAINQRYRFFSFGDGMLIESGIKEAN